VNNRGQVGGKGNERTMWDGEEVGVRGEGGGQGRGGKAKKVGREVGTIGGMGEGSEKKGVAEKVT